MTECFQHRGIYFTMKSISDWSFARLEVRILHYVSPFKFISICFCRLSYSFAQTFTCECEYNNLVTL
jgi:hypothetical protein